MNDTAAYAGNVTSPEAWEMMNADDSALLIDVRTKAEWAFVGVPVLNGAGSGPLLVEWQSFPSMEHNPDFVRTVSERVAELGGGPESTLLFLCRSGARSQAAATAMTDAGFAHCYNVADGFEGPVDQTGQRGKLQGWKASGLPWAQP